ncbi:UNVERIFIED_CONTAM: hypothetical protein FKN15_029485 [Acipenser sinensis]
MDRNALAELLQALESRRDAEERRREERYTALIERSIICTKCTKYGVLRVQCAPRSMHQGRHTGRSCGRRKLS